MMAAKAWHLLVLICSTINAVWVGVAWHNGDPASWFVWVSAILFSASVAITALSDLVEEPA